MDLFATIGNVERAEIQYEPNGRSRGTGVVEFDNEDTAETAIGMFPASVDVLCIIIDLSTAKFTGYQYGGRPLGITFVKYLGGNDYGDYSQDQVM